MEEAWDGQDKKEGRHNEARKVENWRNKIRKVTKERTPKARSRRKKN